MEGVIQVSQLLGPVIGSSLLMLGIYVPFYPVFVLACLSIPLALLLPEESRLSHIERSPSERCKHSDGLTVRREGSIQSTETDSLLRPHSAMSRISGISGESFGQKSIAISIDRDHSKDNFSRLCNAAWVDMKQFWALFIKFPIVKYAYAASLVVTLGKQALHILLQYTSKRFGITIAEVGYIQSQSLASFCVVEWYCPADDILPGRFPFFHQGHRGTRALFPHPTIRTKITSYAFRCSRRATCAHKHRSPRNRNYHHGNLMEALDSDSR